MSIEIPTKWDHEADVIVVGGGTAGLPAAIKVVEAGGKATVLETRKICGGSFRMLGGAISFAGTEEEARDGIEDSPDKFCEQMITTGGADPDIARAFADNQLKAYRLLKDGGMVWNEYISLPDHNVERSFAVGNRGVEMTNILIQKAVEVGVEIIYEHRGKRLIADSQTGRVVGIQVQLSDKIKNFKAKKAVILASGGFGRNKEILDEYAPHMVDCVPMMPPSHQGDGLKMAMALGAATKDMGIAVAPSWAVDVKTHQNAPMGPMNSGGVLINKYGKRFYDESVWYGHTMGEALRQPDKLFWSVYDSKIRVAPRPVAGSKGIDKATEIKADTLEELAKIAGIDPKGLIATINKYNSDLDTAGYDLEFGRKYLHGYGGELVKIDVPPFYAIRCLVSITSMKGGLKTNAKAQVINQFGEVIPSLYAAGEVAGGLHRHYILGLMSSGSMTFGVIAGENAVKESSW